MTNLLKQQATMTQDHQLMVVGMLLDPVLLQMSGKALSSSANFLKTLFACLVDKVTDMERGVRWTLSFQSFDVEMDCVKKVMLRLLLSLVTNYGLILNSTNIASILKPGETINEVQVDILRASLLQASRHQSATSMSQSSVNSVQILLSEWENTSHNALESCKLAVRIY